jgi:hypothetical protein
MTRHTPCFSPMGTNQGAIGATSYSEKSVEGSKSKGLFSSMKATFSRLRSDSTKSSKVATIDSESASQNELPIPSITHTPAPTCESNILTVNSGRESLTVDSARQSTKVRHSISARREEGFKLEDIEIMKLVGKGGFAKVYQVRRKSDSRVFALKVMRKDHVRKMKQVVDF